MGSASTSVTAGGEVTCGVTTGGAAYCWGSGYGAIGDGTGDGSWTPRAVTGGLSFKSLSPGQVDGLRPHHQWTRLLLGNGGQHRPPPTEPLQSTIRSSTCRMAAANNPWRSRLT